MPRLTVCYVDGTTQVVATTMRDAVAAEKALGSLSPVQGGLYAVWNRLRPGVPFEEWVDTVDQLQPADAPAQEPGPTPGE